MPMAIRAAMGHAIAHPRDDVRAGAGRAGFERAYDAAHVLIASRDGRLPMMKRRQPLLIQS